MMPNRVTRNQWINYWTSDLSTQKASNTEGILTEFELVYLNGYIKYDDRYASGNIGSIHGV